MLKTRIFCAKRFMSGQIDVGIGQETREGRAVATQVIFEKIPEDQMVNPVFQLYPDEAQFLMDQLWDCGIRPSEGSGSAGSLKATQNHLEDMRKISFDLLKTRTTQD